jgi:hypothetical protein
VEQSLMAAPPKVFEKIVAILTPPARRDEFLGDLHERYRSPLHYISDAWFGVPCVIYSQVRRTANPGILLLDAMLLYLSFFAAAWMLDREFLYTPLATLKLAIPVAVTVIGVMLADVYALPGKRSRLRPFVRAVVGIGMAVFAEAALRAAGLPIALPWWIVSMGFAMGAGGVSWIGMRFPPDDHTPRGAG